MIKLFYVEDEMGKVRFKDSFTIESFETFDIRYRIVAGNSVRAAFYERSTDNEIARIAYDIKYDGEFLDVVKNTKNVLHPVNREEFFDWLKEHHPDIMTHLLWYV